MDPDKQPTDPSAPRNASPSSFADRKNKVGPAWRVMTYRTAYLGYRRLRISLCPSDNTDCHYEVVRIVP